MKNRNFFIVMSTAIATAVAGCGGTSNSVMQSVAAVDQVVSAGLGIPPVSAAGFSTLATPTQNVSAVIDAPVSPQLSAMVNEALPQMQAFLSEAACYDNRDDRGAVNRRYFLVSQHLWVQYPKIIMSSETDNCVTLTYVGNFSAKADNNFTFDAHYKAPSSGERTQHRGQMQRQQSGEWLFLNFNLAN